MSELDKDRVHLISVDENNNIWSYNISTEKEILIKKNSKKIDQGIILSESSLIGIYSGNMLSILARSRRKELRGYHLGKNIGIRDENYIDEVITVAISPNNKYIVTGSFDNAIKVFDYESKQEIYQFDDAHTRIKSSYH